MAAAEMFGRAMRLLGSHSVMVVHGAQRFWEYNTCNNCEQCRECDLELENQVAQQLVKAGFV